MTKLIRGLIEAYFEVKSTRHAPEVLQRPAVRLRGQGMHLRCYRGQEWSWEDKWSAAEVLQRPVVRYRDLRSYRDQQWHWEDKACTWGSTEAISEVKRTGHATEVLQRPTARFRGQDMHLRSCRGQEWSWEDKACSWGQAEVSSEVERTRHAAEVQQRPVERLKKCRRGLGWEGSDLRGQGMEVRRSLNSELLTSLLTYTG